MIECLKFVNWLSSRNKGTLYSDKTYISVQNRITFLNPEFIPTFYWYMVISITSLFKRFSFYQRCFFSEYEKTLLVTYICLEATYLHQTPSFDTYTHYTG